MFEGPGRTIWCSLVVIASLMAWQPVCDPQQEIARNRQGDLLPATTGEPLTVSPTDRPDLPCSVVEWTLEPVKPALTVLCPPEQVLAPLHVYLKVSWLKKEDVPAYARTIQAPSKTPTKLHTDRTAVWILLDVQEKQDAPLRRKWVAFTGVVDVALLSLASKR